MRPSAENEVGWFPDSYIDYTMTDADKASLGDTYKPGYSIDYGWIVNQSIPKSDYGPPGVEMEFVFGSIESGGGSASAEWPGFSTEQIFFWGGMYDYMFWINGQSLMQGTL
jgi:hypothetical protein